MILHHLIGIRAWQNMLNSWSELITKKNYTICAFLHSFLRIVILEVLVWPKQGAKKCISTIFFLTRYGGTKKNLWWHGYYFENIKKIPFFFCYNFPSRSNENSFLVLVMHKHLFGTNVINFRAWPYFRSLFLKLNPLNPYVKIFSALKYMKNVQKMPQFIFLWIVWLRQN